MAGNIKGITIEFRGDPTPLDKALRKIQSESNKTQRELTSINKALKFNPTSVDLWRQKQQVLNEKIKQTEERQKTLKDALKKMDDSGISHESEEYRRFQRELIETESKLKTFKAQLREIGNVKLRAMSEQFKEMGNKLTSAGQAMRGISTAAAAVTAAIGAAAVKSGKWADDLNTMSKVYSISTTDLQKYAAAADLVDVSVETIAKSHVKLEKQMLAASKGTGASAEAFEALGVSVTNADGSLRSGDSVWQDTIKALGSLENETERDAYAMQLMGRSASELNPLIEDNGETYKMVADTMAKYGLDYVDQDTLNKANEFNDSLDTMKLLGTTAFNQMATQLSAYLAPAMQKAVDLVGQLAAWLANLSPETQTIIVAIAGVVAVLAPLLIGLGKVSFAISSIMSLAATLGPIIGGLAGPIGIAIAVFAALVAAGVLVYKNWDTIKAKAIELKNKVVTAFNELKSKMASVWKAITTPITNAVNTIRNAINKIRSIVNNAHLKLPKFKLPHFKISGGKLPWGIGGKGTAPKISVDWYAEGGIFNKATLAGIGEAGPEAVVPLDTLWNKLDNIAKASAANNEGITINVYASPHMNVDELARRIEIRLATLQRQKRATYGI